MLHCFECGSDLPDNVIFCLNCGAKLPLDDKTIVIPVVGAPTPAPVPTDDEPPTQDREPSVPPPVTPGIMPESPASMSGAVKAAIAVMALFIVGAVFYLFGRLSVDPPATPTSSPTPKPSRSNTPPVNATIDTNAAVDTKVLYECVASNQGKGTVNLRRDCDTKNCEMDPATKYTQIPDGTRLSLLDLGDHKTGRMTWRPVLYRGERLWISSAKLSCAGE